MITVEATDAKQLIKESVLWTDVPPVCPMCGADLALLFRNPQSYEYYGLRCLGTPQHEATFGEYKDHAKGLYYKDQWTVSMRSNAPQIGDGKEKVVKPAPQQKSQPTTAADDEVF